MSTEYNAYIEKMKSDYKNAKQEIELYVKENPNSKSMPTNEMVKTYVVHLFIGTGLKDESENISALKQLYSIHTNYMKEYYEIIGWGEITR